MKGGNDKSSKNITSLCICTKGGIGGWGLDGPTSDVTVKSSALILWVRLKAGPHVFRLVACSENQNHELTMSLSMRSIAQFHLAGSMLQSPYIGTFAYRLPSSERDLPEPDE
jgi:hypothetical protein